MTSKRVKNWLVLTSRNRNTALWRRRAPNPKYFPENSFWGVRRSFQTYSTCKTTSTNERRRSVGWTNLIAESDEVIVD
jgi:hypothetical protein